MKEESLHGVVATVACIFDPSDWRWHHVSCSVYHVWFIRDVMNLKRQILETA